jgi:hypothetical protein
LNSWNNCIVFAQLKIAYLFFMQASGVVAVAALRPPWVQWAGMAAGVAVPKEAERSDLREAC